MILFGLSCIAMNLTCHISDELSTNSYTFGYILIAFVIIAAGSSEWHMSSKDWMLGILVLPLDGLSYLDPFRGLPMG